MNEQAKNYSGVTSTDIEEASDSKEERDKLRDIYLELTRRQSSDPNWSDEDRREFLELQKIFGKEAAGSTDEKSVLAALHRQGLASTRDRTGSIPHEELTAEERNLIIKENLRRSPR